MSNPIEYKPPPSPMEHDRAVQFTNRHELNVTADALVTYNPPPLCKDVDEWANVVSLNVMRDEKGHEGDEVRGWVEGVSCEQQKGGWNAEEGTCVLTQPTSDEFVHSKDVRVSGVTPLTSRP